MIFFHAFSDYRSDSLSMMTSQLYGHSFWSLEDTHSFAYRFISYITFEIRNYIRTRTGSHVKFVLQKHNIIFWKPTCIFFSMLRNDFSYYFNKRKRNVLKSKSIKYICCLRVFRVDRFDFSDTRTVPHSLTDRLQSYFL